MAGDWRRMDGGKGCVVSVGLVYSLPFGSCFDDVKTLDVHCPSPANSARSPCSSARKTYVGGGVSSGALFNCFSGLSERVTGRTTPAPGRGTRKSPWAPLAGRRTSLSTSGRVKLRVLGLASSLIRLENDRAGPGRVLFVVGPLAGRHASTHTHLGGRKQQPMSPQPSTMRKRTRMTAPALSPFRDSTNESHLWLLLCACE